VRISAGNLEKGEGGGGRPSISDGARGMSKFAKEISRSFVGKTGALETAAEEVDEGTVGGFFAKEDGGKCLFLYKRSTSGDIL